MNGSAGSTGGVGGFGDVASGAIPGQVRPTSCFGFTVDDIAMGGSSIQTSSSIMMIAAVVGEPDREITASGILTIESMLYNGSVLQRRTYSGPEFNSRLGAPYLVESGAEELHGVTDPTAYTDPVVTYESAIFRASKPVDQITYFDWLHGGTGGATASVGPIESGCNYHCIRSNWWTHRVACEHAEVAIGVATDIAAWLGLYDDGPWTPVQMTRFLYR